MPGDDPQTPRDAGFQRYRHDVERSLAFCGVRHEVFIKAKADALLDLAARRLGSRDGLSVLDVGCGFGLFHKHLSGAAGELHGVDVDESVVAEAQRANPRSRFGVYDGVTLPFAAGRFDIAFAANVVHHLTSERVDPFLAELLRVVRSGGLGVVFEHNPLNPLARLAVSRCELDRDANLQHPGRIDAGFAAAGARVFERRYILFVPSGRPWVRRLERGLAWLPLGAQWYVAAER